MPRVSALHIYPIKGCGGIQVDAAPFDAQGPKFDRRFMVVDAQGRFLSQREVPHLSRVNPALTEGTLTVAAEGMRALSLPLSMKSERRKRVSVWGDSVQAEPMGADAARWFEEFLGRPCELVRFPDDAVRKVDPRYASGDARVGFADAYPVLLLSEASLDALNSRLAAPLPMDRFRPNVVVTGTAAHAEDGWKTIRAGELVLSVVKPCDRCSVTTVDQETGVRGKEPLRTLAQYRRRGGKVYFGQNCVHQESGTVRVGDEVEVLEEQEPLGFEG